MATVGFAIPVEADVIRSAETRLNAGCCHHWVINNPGGPLSPGTCKLCGQRREFNNSLPVREYHRRGGRQADAVTSVKDLTLS